MTDITFHYPPELFNLLVDAIPALNRGKRDVLVFFRGAAWRSLGRFVRKVEKGNDLGRDESSA